MVGFGRHVVINYLSLNVRRGEILGLVGASGGGKSVLMRTIIGLIPRQNGKIEVMGAAIGATMSAALITPREDGASCFSRVRCFLRSPCDRISSFPCEKI